MSFNNDQNIKGHTNKLQTNKGRSKNGGNINYNIIGMNGGIADCSFIDPQKYEYCDKPIEELNDAERVECDRVKGPYRYEINENDPEMSGTKCKKNTGAITYECAKERFNSYYDLKNQYDSGKMRGKLFDVKYNKKPSLILYPGEPCSSKYLHGEGVKTFDIWGVDAFPEDSCAVFSEKKHVTSKCYSDEIKNEIKYGPELSGNMSNATKERLYNQHFTGNSQHLAKARAKNWENFHKNPKVRKISPKTNEEFLEYMIERNTDEDRPVREKRYRTQQNRNIPTQPIFQLHDDDQLEDIADPDTPLSNIAIENKDIAEDKEDFVEEIESPITDYSLSSSPKEKHNEVLPFNVLVEKEDPLSDLPIVELSSSTDDIVSEINDIDAVFDIPQIDDDESIDWDLIFKQPEEREYSANILEDVKKGIISDFDTFANLIVVDDIIGKKRVYYLYNAENNFIYEIPLNMSALLSQFDYENKIQIEAFFNQHSEEIYDKLQTPYYPIGSYFGSDEFQFYE
jgi:hypothetical protein